MLEFNNLKVSGNAELVEVYENSRDQRYYARLHLSLSGQSLGNTLPSSKVEVDVPIPQAQYHYLREQLKESKAEMPVLRVTSDLSLVVDAACIN